MRKLATVLFVVLLAIAGTAAAIPTQGGPEYAVSAAAQTPTMSPAMPLAQKGDGILDRAREVSILSCSLSSSSQTTMCASSSAVKGDADYANYLTNMFTMFAVGNGNQAKEVLAANDKAKSKAKTGKAKSKAPTLAGEAKKKA